MNIRAALPLREVPLWARLAMQDIVIRYRRSTLGPWWITITCAAFVLGVGTLYATLLNQSVREFQHYLAVGIVSWQFLSGCINEGADSLISGRSLLLNTRIEANELILRVLARNSIVLLHMLPILAVTGIWAYPSSGFEPLGLALGIAFLFLNGLWLATVFAIVSARYRDVPPMLQPILQFAFIISPIIWSADVLPERSVFVDFNPVAHIVDAVRSPLMASGTNLVSVLVSGSVGLAGSLFAFLMYKATRKRLSYWA